MTYQNLALSQTDHIHTIKINRPKQLNALNLDTLIELERAVREAEENENIRAILLTGEGDKAFVAGADLLQMKELNLQQAEEFVQQGHRTMDALEGCEKPVIAAVNGFCLGGGMELALACDMILASEKAVFGLPEVTLGLFPGWGGTQRLTRLVGKNRAKEVILSGKKYSAEEALKMGIINRIFPSDMLAVEAQRLAGAIAANAPCAVRFAKTLINEASQTPLSEGLALERSYLPKCFETEDLQEGFDAFVGKREAHFKGK